MEEEWGEKREDVLGKIEGGGMHLYVTRTHEPYSHIKFPSLLLDSPSNFPTFQVSTTSIPQSFIGLRDRSLEFERNARATESEFRLKEEALQEEGAKERRKAREGQEEVERYGLEWVFGFEVRVRGLGS